jgi:Flp pilus assembly protein TadG
VIPIMGFIGSAVDYSRANSARSAMQSAIDATALMLSKEITTLTSTQISDKATAYFNALYNNHANVAGVTITPDFTAGGSQLVVTGSGNVNTTFMKAMGLQSLNINVSSTIKWGNTRLRVALVLDNTGSMSDYNKIGALKTATNNLLTQLRNAASQNGDVYVSIVPFVKDVAVDKTSNSNATWIDWTDWNAVNGTCSQSSYTTQSTCEGRGTCSLSAYTTQSTCVAHGTCSLSSYTTQNTCVATCSLAAYTTQSTCVAQGTCSKAGYTTQSTCVAQSACSKPQYTNRNTCQDEDGTWGAARWTPATWTTPTWTTATWIAPIWTANNHSTWNGCITDRGASGAPSILNTDTNVMAPNPLLTDTLFPAEQFTSCPQPVMGLNYNWTAMTTLVNNMSPAGNTNQAIGLAWGWLSLVGGGPFTMPAKDPNYTYSDVIILLTDGLNTQDRWYASPPLTTTQAQTSIDARQRMTCDNIYAAGITLYTIQVNTGGDPTSTLLQNCAGTPNRDPAKARYPDPSKFFLLTSANAMVTTFNQIGTQLSNLRVAK